MRIVDILRGKAKPTVSFELFPARTPKAAAAQALAIDELAALAPDFVSVTFGAGGSTREGSHALVQSLRARGLETLAYLAGYGLAPATLGEIADAYRALGVDNVLAVRGDRPEDAAFVPQADAPAHASDLLALLAARTPFCLGAAAYPEGHREAANFAADVDFLRLKVERGAAFLISQYGYLEGKFAALVQACRRAGIGVPIVAGVMPIFSIKMMESLAALCGATIPADLRAGLAGLPADDAEALIQFGVELAVKQCRELVAAGAAGLHFYTMNKSRSAVAIVRALRAEGLV